MSQKKRLECIQTLSRDCTLFSLKKKKKILMSFCSTCLQLHLQCLPQPADQLPGGVHSLPVQHHCQCGLQHVVRLHHRGWDHAQQVSYNTQTYHFRLLLLYSAVVLLNTSVCVLAVRTCRTLI